MQLGDKLAVGSKPGDRDAFHAPSVVACSREEIKPGDVLLFDEANLSSCEVWRLRSGSPIRWGHAVADPFAQPEGGSWSPGELFWAILRPGIASGLTHHFEMTIPKSMSRAEVAASAFEGPDFVDAERCGGKGC